MPWQDDLQPASWRGVPFGVDVADSRHGRNTGVHEYPYRESAPAWAEDTGLMAGAHRITGYLIGDDVAAQQQSLIAAVNQAGAGELVHPTLGALTGSIVGGLQTVLRNGAGRYIELTFAFLENDGTPEYPAIQADTQGDVTDAADSARTLTLVDIVSSIGSGFQQAQAAVREMQSIGGQALSIAGSASSLFGVARILPGNFGRYLGGGSVLGAITTTSSAISAANAAASNVTSTVGRLQSLAARL